MKVKLKTKSAAKKRFKKVGSKGLFKRSHSLRRHKLTKKSSKRKRNLRKIGYINKSDAPMVARMLPY